MSLWESLKMAWSSLLANKLRSSLTMLGIIIGVAAVIALVGIGQGASKSVTARIQELGSNLITLNARGAGRLYLDDLEELRRRVPALSRLVPSMTRTATAKWRTQTYETTVEGTGEGYTEVRNFPVATGRFINQEDVDARRKVVVVGRKVVENLFGGVSPLRETISINGQPFTVVGVMSPKGQGIGGDFDDRILMPVSTAQRLFGTNRIPQIMAQVASADQAPATVARIQAIYRQKFPTKNPGRDDAILVFSQDQLLSTVGDTTRTFTVMLGGIAGISLLVGGIGIMNIMLVSVTERTREIGIRKALGARRRDILAQFLVESLVLSAAGGLLGVALGYGAAQAATLVGLTAAVAPQSVALAFVVSVGVGIFFGLYPAVKASALDPIEALRYD